MSGETESKYGLKFYFVAVIIVAICAFELFVLFAWTKGVWLEKFNVLLAVLGLYGLALGFFSKSDVLAPLKEILTELSSPNPLVFLRANAIFCVFVSMIGARGCEPKMEGDCPSRPLWLLGLFLWIPIAVILFVYAILHLFIITPLTYLPMVVVSAIITKINCSTGDDILTIGDKRISVKSIIKGDTTTVKGFIIGVPSLAISFLGQVFLIIT